MDRRSSERSIADKGIRWWGEFIFRKRFSSGAKKKASLDLTLAQFSLMTPYPGTKEFERAEEDDLLLTEDWSRYTGLEPVMKVPGVAEEELKGLASKAYKDFYFRLSFLWKVVKEGELWAWLKTLLTSV